ncbi:MAG TPA: polyprenyl synthetase family protein [Bacteroidales bacterium]|jgi:octaprenyl-diphosphate synthase|nr:polyprenyl synthetase family protein [Bacteroidales bacterium]HNR41315.1 polyprenyl synthetase family protein [Bacteroidales bacterium]HPM18356.1 polyprenyl synthetase family protein [Bacteroidales bacterium]HQG75990.1 polyprenyl synthetase family protein [Bacteroidales bacterium]
MPDLRNISRPVREEMARFEAYFGKTMESEIPLLKIILNYIFRRKGKQMRPLLVFLSAKLNGTITESTFVAATFIELLHTASIVHDDVVDDSRERRGALSINALWNSKIAVLVGDYMLSKGLLIGIQKNSVDMLEIVSEAVQSMSKGELLQLQKARKLNIREEDYFKIISCKTAALIAACTACGARSVTDDLPTIQLMKEFGEQIGMAFQIRDDIFDYESNGLTGKPNGNDIREKKITLPLIYSLEKSSRSERKHILNVVGRKHKSRADIDEVIAFVREYDGIESASRKMNYYRDQALSILDTYPESEVRRSLRDFVYYTVSRDK